MKQCPVNISALARVALAMLVVALAGCASQQFAKTSTAKDKDVAPQVSGEVIGFSVKGKPIECVTLGDGPVTVLLLASIHGSEPAGMPLLNELVLRLRKQPESLKGRRVLVIAQANPDGLEAKKRHNNHGVDLNRNFPSTNWEERHRQGKSPSSEPESAALRVLIESRKPDRIISIHQPLGCIDFDGPGESLARAMASASGLPVKRLGGQSGSLGSFAGNDLGIPVITVELPGATTRLDNEAMWKKWGPMLLEAIRHERVRSNALEERHRSLGSSVCALSSR
ncbi:MAG: DUF2817 domain-containing protein [Planctomycetes bacterium]|nr:DUF2817 domain-containing protein [Planctomycetota bacterium]